MLRERNHGGIIHRSLQPGSFYRCAGIGEFQDGSCNVVVPGCTAVVDDRLRVVTELRLPERVVQIPHAKMTTKMGKHPEDPVEWQEVSFGDYCPLGIGEALQMAADSGVIVEIRDDEMQALWPECWAARRERIVFDPRELKTGSAEPMVDLIERAKKERLAEARKANREADDTARAAAARKANREADDTARAAAAR